MRALLRSAALLCLPLGFLLTIPQLHAQKSAAPVATPGERRALKAFDAAKGNPLALHALLVNLPKGADLHMHLSGAVYAETFLADAAADGMCVDPVKLKLAKAQAATKSLPPQPVCGEGLVRADSVFKSQSLYDALVDSFSMRSFVPSAGVSGHDQFFATFDRFGGTDKRHLGEWLDEVATRAAAQNEQYLEVMNTPSDSVGNAIKRTAALGWPAAPASPEHFGLDTLPSRSTLGPDASDTLGTTPAELAAYREKLLAGGLRDDLAGYKAEIAAALAKRNDLEHCGQPNAAAACAVEIRFLFQVLRAFPPQQVFAHTLSAFELAQADPEHVVGLNFVQPEDNYVAMAEYVRQMHMLDYLHSVYPTVHISLHAGELAPGMSPPAGLTFHIRQAVELGHAERIGHGVDVMYEDRPQQLLKEMAERHVMVEVNLTSNDVILGISANHHALPAYRAAHVPVALSTDDEGVSRIDLTHEYVRAVVDQHLGYLDLKQSARASLEHSFIPGASLWARPDEFGKVRSECAGQPVGAENPKAACTEFLRNNRRAAQQWELEHRYQVFESSLP